MVTQYRSLKWTIKLYWRTHDTIKEETHIYKLHWSKYAARFWRTLAFWRVSSGRLGVWVGDGGGGHCGVYEDAGSWDKWFGREGVGGRSGIVGLEEMGVEWAKGGPRKGEGSGDAGGWSQRTMPGDGGVRIRKSGAGMYNVSFLSMFTCKKSRIHLLHSYESVMKRSKRIPYIHFTNRT